MVVMMMMVVMMVMAPRYYDHGSPPPSVVMVVVMMMMVVIELRYLRIGLRLPCRCPLVERAQRGCGVRNWFQQVGVGIGLQHVGLCRGGRCLRGI